MIRRRGCDSLRAERRSVQGFTRCEQECKIPADGVGWLSLAHASGSRADESMFAAESRAEAKILSPVDSVRDLPAALVEAGRALDWWLWIVPMMILQCTLNQFGGRCFVDGLEAPSGQPPAL